jgi:superfamily II DNA helicase RecQ
MSGGSMIPYHNAQCSMFNTLVPQNRLQHTSSATRLVSHVIDEEAMAQRIAKLIVPSLNDIITKAIESALCKIPDLPVHSKSHMQEDLDGAEMSLYDDPLPVIGGPTSKPDTAAHKPLHEFSASSSEPSLLPARINRPSNNASGGLLTDITLVESSPTHIPITSLMTQALNKVRSLVGDPNATWTDDAQRDAMEAVLRLQTDVMAVMCTGSGKTMLAIVPSLLEDAVTVVVLPLKSLMMDYRRKLDGMGVLYEEFTSKTTTLSGAHNLVLVSADRAKSEQWYQALAELNTRIPVHRTVVDEAQLAFTSDDFRSSLREMHELRQFPMQMIVLSATIPEQSQSTVIDIFGLGPNTVIFRTPTVRPEHRYILETPRSNNRLIASRVKEIIDLHKSELTSEDRVLLFVPFLDQGELVAQTLKCEFYHGSSTLSDAERLAIHDRWFNGTHQFMVCTSAFGAGNDHKHVRMVIHAGTPQEMIGTTQEMGRGGRDHRCTYCYILPRNPQTPPTIPQGTIDHKGKLAMYQWVFPNRPICLRFGLTSFCDPIGAHCSDKPAFQKCSVCLPVEPPSQRIQDIQMALESTLAVMARSAINSSSSSLSKGHVVNQSAMATTVKRTTTSAFNEAYETSKRRKVDTQVKRSEYVDNMLLVLAYFEGICAYCKMQGKEVDKHAIIRCPYIDSGDGKGEEKYVLWRDKIKYQGFHSSICYRCHVPQIDDRLHSTFMKGGAACHHPDVIAPVAYAIFRNHGMRKAAEGYFSQRWTDLNQFMKWINSKPVQGHESNLTALTWWYYFAYQLNNTLN